MLSKIVSQVGKPCYTDKITTEMGKKTSEGKLTYALEVEASNDLRDKIVLSSFSGFEIVQEIHYKWKP